MYITNALLALILAQSAALSLASPASLTIRTPLCANLPNTAAGTIPHHRNPTAASPHPPPSNPLHPRATGIIWCLGGTPLYIILDTTPLPTNDPLIPLIKGALENATTGLLHHVEAGNVGPVTNWVFRWPVTEDIVSTGVVLVGHAVSGGKGLTWSVLDGAFLALWDYMQYEGYGLGQFRIYYGAEGQVGRGALRQNRI